MQFRLSSVRPYPFAKLLKIALARLGLYSDFPSDLLVSAFSSSVTQCLRKTVEIDGKYRWKIYFSSLLPKNSDSSSFLASNKSSISSSFLYPSPSREFIHLDQSQTVSERRGSNGVSMLPKKADGEKIGSFSRVLLLLNFLLAVHCFSAAGE